MAKSFSIFARLLGKDESKPVLNGLGKIRAAGKATTGSLKASFGSITGVIGAVGTALAGSALGSLILKYGESSEEIGNLSRQIGISAEALQEFRFAADMVDISVEEMDGGLQKFAVSLGQAQAGTGKLASFLKRVDPTGTLLEQFKNAGGVEGAFNLAVQAMEKVPDPTRRAALSVALFGKELGPKMARMADEGVEGIRRLRAEGHQFVRSNDAIENAGKFEDALKRMRWAAKGWANVIAAEMIPDLTPLLQEATAWLMENRAEVKAWLKDAMQSVRRVLVWIHEHWSGIVSTVKVLATFWIGSKLLTSVVSVGRAAWDIYKAFKAISLVKFALPGIPGGTTVGGIGSRALGLVTAPAAVAAAGVGYAFFGDYPAKATGAIADWTGGANPFINPADSEWNDETAWQRDQIVRKIWAKRQQEEEERKRSFSGFQGVPAGSRWATPLAMDTAKLKRLQAKVNIHVDASDDLKARIKSIKGDENLDVSADVGERDEFSDDGGDGL